MAGFITGLAIGLENPDARPAAILKCESCTNGCDMGLSDEDIWKKKKITGRAGGRKEVGQLLAGLASKV